MPLVAARQLIDGGVGPLTAYLWVTIAATVGSPILAIGAFRQRRAGARDAV